MYFQFKINSSSILSGITKSTCDWELGDGKYICQKNMGENPYFGYVGYDNILWGFLSALSLATLDEWEFQYTYVYLIIFLF